MIQRPFNGANNGEGEVFSQQSEFEVNVNPTKATPFRPAGQRSTFSNIPVNRGTTHIFYKTRICQKFIEGNCRNGDGCTFAHGPKDLREPPPNWQELVKDNNNSNINNNNNNNRGGNWSDDQKIIHRMRICRKFYHGDECPYGEKCNFLHEDPAKFKGEVGMDSGRARESSVINIQTAVDYGKSKTEAGQDSFTTVKTDQDGPRVKTNFWKTQVCGKWETTGQCIFADKCHFAHGLAELHNPVGQAGGSVAAHMVYGPPTTEPPLVTGSATAVPVARQGIGKGFLKLANRKVNRIYGDWIDDDEDDLS